VIGPILGAIVLTTISEYSRVYLGKFGGLDMILYGVLVILIVLFMPGGILSAVEEQSGKILAIFKKEKPVKKIVEQ